MIETIRINANTDALTIRICESLIPFCFFMNALYNIQMIYNISFPQAALGDKIQIPTPYGKTKIKIPSGFVSGI